MRAIDADAFKEYIRGACEDMKHLFKDNADFAKLITESFCKDIDEQPTIHPEPHWIPVTEEPIPDGEYLVTWTSEIQEKPILSIVYRYSEVWDCWELQLLGHQDINILAYMPLPEPYKGVTE